jgi:hypothetical protein
MKLPIKCPSCEESLQVTKLSCTNCSTEISGKFDLPIFLQLSMDEQNFILNFFLSSGSIKEMAKQAELSYPTMRNRMDDLIEKIEKIG